jgi:tetratricopeptide (TPR) repeat protein
VEHVQIFLSAVSAEFRSYREALHRKLERQNLTVKVQEDFIAGGSETLDKLDDYIRHCHAVIHLVGDMTGALAPPPSATLVARCFPDLRDRLPMLAPFLEAGAPRLSYTQWEAWLAVYHGKRLFIAVPEDGVNRDDSYRLSEAERVAQQEHLQRLRAAGSHSEIHFTDTKDLAIEVLRSKLQEILAAAGGINRPTNLPNLSIGQLFKGREDALQELAQSLGPVPDSSTAPAVVRVLNGLGGVGKTRLAVEYAWRRAGNYAARLFVGASDPEALQRNLAALCGRALLDLPEQTQTDQTIQSDAVLAWLRQHPGWLLILDNIDAKPAARAAEALVPQLTGGHVLLTSRLQHWAPAFAPMPLDVLSLKAAVEFLLVRTQGRRRQGTDELSAAQELARELGCLALALEQAGAYIALHRQTFAQYLVDWQCQRDKVLAWFDERLMNYPKSVAITWQTTVDQLGEPARRLLQRLAWLAPEPVPESLLDVPVPSANDEDGGFRDALSELESYSLVVRTADAPVFSIHRLVQEVTRLSQAGGEAVPVALVDTLHWIDAAFAGHPEDVRDWPVLEPLAPHARAVVAQTDAAGIADVTARLMNQVGILMLAQASYVQAEPLMRRALAIDEASFGAQHPKAAIGLNNLAQLLQATNRLAEAEPLMRRALAIDEGSFGAQHPKVAVDLNNLALLLEATNRLAEAEPLMRRALAIDEASVGAQHPEIAIRLNNLAQLLQATNRLAEAEPLMRRALAIDEASFGTQHPRVAIELNNLALLLNATNRLAEAEPLMRRALAIDEASFGTQHHRVARDLNNLAQLLQTTNRLAEAEPLMRRALAIDEASFGTQHPEVAIRLNNLALLLQATNRLAEAEPLMRRALAIDEASFGAQHPKVAIRLNNLAQLLQDTNRLAEAEPLMHRALAIDEASFGAQHPDVGRDLNNLAQLLKDTNRLAEAEPLMHRALAIDEASFGAQHPKVAIRLNNLAQLLKDTNRLAEAEPLMRRALAIDEASFGEQHPEVGRCLNNLAQLLQDTNRLAEAEPLMRRALFILENSFQQDHPMVATARGNLKALLQAAAVGQSSPDPAK